MTLRNLYYNYISHPNYFDDGGIVYIQDNNGFIRPDSVQTINGNYTSGINPQNAVLNDYQLNQVNKAERKQTASEKAQNFIDNMNGGGASGWNAIGPAASNIASALLDTESDLADRTAAAMGMPALANIWKADWKKGNEALTDYRNKLNNIKKNSFIQDASSSWGAANAVKLNSKPIAPITPQSQLLTWKDFRGNMFTKGAGAVAQGAASGSVGGPWGAAGGAITGLLGSLFGGIGARKRAKSAYNSYLNKWQTLNSANQAAFNKANIDHTLSNMQALANGNLQQRINDMSNIRAFGGSLDLSPNMINLWNNKQYIDQQRVNTQQMNFGLGNSFNYKNMFPNGGQIDSSDLPNNAQYYANGGTHEENPYGGVQVGTDQQGNPNLVEEGEFRWGDYVFSDRISVDPTLLSRYNLAPATKHQNKKANKGKLSYADMAKKYAKKNNELANDPIGKNTLEAYMKRLQDAQEDQKFQDSMEQQKQDAINQYRNALTTQQQGNPMYGAMKYSGMGNAATQQGVNAGMSDLGQQGGGNEVLSNTNRSGNNMLHAFGGNLFWDGGTPQIKPKLLNVNPNLVLSDNYMDSWTANNAGTPRLFSSITPMYTGENPEDNFTAYQKRYPTLPSDAKGMQQLLVNEGYDIGNTGQNKDGVDGIWGNKSQAAWYDFLRAYNHRPNTMNQYDIISSNNQPSTSNNQASYSGSLNLGIRDGGAATDVTNNGDGQNSVSYNATTNTGRQDLTGNLGGNTGSVNNTNNQTDRTTTTTFGTAAIKGDPKQVPHYNTAGEYAMFGKGFTPMLYDWMNKTNTKYDPNQRPAYELADMGNNSTFLRTADTVGGYRAPNLMDVERMNNAAQAQGLAALQSALSTANGNRGFAAAQAAQNAYNTQMGIGNNYATTQQINNDERFKNDSFNTALDQANANIRNSMYQDNQKGQQFGQQIAIDTKKAANDYILRNELYADATNREAMANRAANQATWTDNALNYFIAQAQKNDILNAKNNDITNPYWTDKNGVMHYIGDSGLNSAIYNAFTDGSKEWGDYAVNNGTFSGDRLKDWNKLLEKHGAAVLAANPDLWKSLVLQEKQERKKEAEKAELAKTDRLNSQRYAFDNNMAQLNNYRTLYGDKFTDSQWYDDLMKRYNDAANANEFNDVNNLEYWNRVIGDKLNYWQRYNTPVTANQSAYGGYINNNNKSNKREYYNYMRR